MSAMLHRSLPAGRATLPQGWSGYTAPWAPVQKWISVLVLLLLAYGTVLAWRAVPLAATRILLASIPPGIVVMCLGSVVRGYEVTDREILVQRLFWRTRLPLAGLLEVRADPGLTRGSIRLLGNGGFLSTTGIFWNSRQGRFRMLVNDVSRAVLLRYADRKVVVGPGNPERFAHDVACRAGLLA